MPWQPITLGERPTETVAFIASLRDNLERGTVAAWTGAARPGFDTAPLLHLPPAGRSPPYRSETVGPPRS
ncbi:hypothetical protein [Nonomuraea sp. B5E05]|uniref:hypothetical protein n=1 Tax=Nonomuraea sp. B5E05 TaxID=3153569 RepID=UPI0032603AE8